MEQNVYLDVYFIFNFLMDFFVLFVTAIILKKKKQLIRLVFSACLGALYATVILVIHPAMIVQIIGTYFVMAEVMLYTTFGMKGVKQNLIGLFWLYMITFITNGVLNTIYYGFGSNNSMIQKANTKTFGNINVYMVLTVIIVIAGIVQLIADKIRASLMEANNIFSVVIELDNKKIKATGIRDTGNSLIEPITKKPVSIIEEKQLLPFKEQPVKVLMIPYNSVGKKHGILKGFVADRMIIDGKVVEKPVIGIHKGRLSGDKKFNIILHPKIFN